MHFLHKVLAFPVMLFKQCISGYEIDVYLKYLSRGKAGDARMDVRNMEILKKPDKLRYVDHLN